MPACSPPTTQNQLASPRMRKHDAIELQPSPFDMESNPGLGSVLPTAVAVAAGAAVVLGVVASGAGMPIILGLIGLLATVGLFFLFAVAAGYVRFGRKLPMAELVSAATDTLATGIMIARRDGEAVYANRTFETIVGRSDDDRLGALQDLFTGEADATAALFRLARAAERGEPHAEEFSLKAVPGGARSATVMSVTVQPFAARGERRGLVLWRIEDVTADREREAARIAGVEMQLAQFDGAPIGLASVAAGGKLLHINATLADWIGRSARSVADQHITFADITTRDSAGVVNSLLQRNDGQNGTIDVELVHEDGRILPVRLLSKPSPDGRAVTVAVLNLAGENAAEEGDATGARFARFFQSTPFGIAILDPDGRITNANAAFCRMVLEGASGIGVTAPDALCRAGTPEMRTAVEESLERVLSGRASLSPVEITVGTNGEHVARVYMSPFASAGGAKEAAILYVVDATEQKALEAKFAQSQKMEVVGKLAGGIAHDFNNMLTAILGFSDMLLSMHRPKDLAYKDIKNIQQSANRAAELVRKLLALARQQTLQNEVVNLGEVLTEEFNLLKRYLGEKSELKIASEPDLWNVMTDKQEFIQALFNLITNAKDAMPDGGTLTIRARNVPERETQRLGYKEFVPGEYVMIEVGDTGHGMSKEVMDKVFEPFFTTKAIGKGTGLGLASVYGMVKQSGGYIYPESEEGKGTTFRIYLPRHHAEKDDELPAPKEKKKETRAADLTGTGRVLLVEDEEVVRNFAARALKRQGYKVLEASSGVEALEVMEKNKGKIDIVVSDVVMPEMDGPTLLKELRKKNPDLKIIFVSGYPNDAFKASLGEEDFAFLPKPFSLPQLAAKVKEELGR